MRAPATCVRVMVAAQLVSEVGEHGPTGRLAMVASQIQPDHQTRGGRQRREKEPEKSARLSLPRGRTRLRGRTRRVARGSTCRGRCTRLCLRSPNAMFPAGCREALPASLQKSARIVGAVTGRSGLAVFAVSRRRRRCSVRRWRRAYSSRTHSAAGAFHGCCGEGTFFQEATRFEAELLRHMHVGGRKPAASCCFRPFLIHSQFLLGH